MTLEIIIFISAALFGIFIYWRESKNNKFYRFINKLTHAKKYRMSEDNRKGFIYQQNFFIRLMYILVLFLIAFGALSFLIPFDIFGLQMFVASVVGTFLGTYIASAFLFANKKVENNKDFFEEVVEKGKDIIEDIKPKKEKETPAKIEEKTITEEKKAEIPQEKAKEETPKKSARERLKEDGLL